MDAGTPRRDVDEPTGHADVLPTVLHAAAGAPVAMRNVTGRDLLSNEPPPALTLIAASSSPWYGEMVIEFRGHRLLLEMPHDRPEVIVRGTIDRLGNVSPWDLPPADEAADWAAAIAPLLRRMTELRAP